MARIRQDEPSVDKDQTIKKDAAEESAEKIPEEAQDSTSFGEIFGDETAEEKLTEEEITPKELEPVFGGRLRMYVDRGFLDETVSQLVWLSPFSESIGEKALFAVTDSTNRRIELKLTDRFVRGNGQRVTALDFVEHWSQLLKAHPAQGLALFRNIQGAQAYIDGKDPLMRGFRAHDEQTIRMRTDKADPQIFARLNSPKLIPGSLMLGPYYPAAVKEKEVKILPNKHTVSAPVFLQEWDISLGGDSDIMQSFSLGMYEAMIIWSQPDLERVRTQLGDKVTLSKLSSDRYFLSCAIENEQIRRIIRSRVNAADLLKNSVKAEGEEIYSVTVLNENTQKPAPIAAVASIALITPVRIAYRIDDPVSKIIAERLSEDLNANGLQTELHGGNALEYETMLLKKEYDCAVGWVPQTVVDNVTEQLHLATMWFSDDTDSQARIRDSREIPLFSVDSYLLLRDDVRLHGGKLTGIWTERN